MPPAWRLLPRSVAGRPHSPATERCTAACLVYACQCFHLQISWTRAWRLAVAFCPDMKYQSHVLGQVAAMLGMKRKGDASMPPPMRKQQKAETLT